MCSTTAPDHGHLGDLVLAAFAQAWREGRLDVADHLLHALEALTDAGGDETHRTRAYRLLAQGRPS